MADPHFGGLCTTTENEDTNTLTVFVKIHKKKIIFGTSVFIILLILAGLRWSGVLLTTTERFALNLMIYVQDHHHFRHAPLSSQSTITHVVVFTYTPDFAGSIDVLYYPNNHSKSTIHLDVFWNDSLGVSAFDVWSTYEAFENFIYKLEALGNTVRLNAGIMQRAFRLRI